MVAAASTSVFGSVPDMDVDHPMSDESMVLR